MTYRVSASVQAYAERQGITLQELEDMLAKSCLISHAEGNRRFHNWLFRVENGVVRYMQPLATQPKKDTITHESLSPNEFMVYEECDDCRGKGCPTCGYTGELRIVRRLPSGKR